MGREGLPTKRQHPKVCGLDFQGKRMQPQKVDFGRVTNEKKTGAHLGRRPQTDAGLCLFVTLLGAKLENNHYLLLREIIFLDFASLYRSLTPWRRYILQRTRCESFE